MSKALAMRAFALPALMLAMNLSAFGGGREDAAIEFGPWSGAITPRSAVVKAKLSRAGVKARLAVSRNEDFRQSKYGAEVVAAEDRNRMVAFALENLDPNTEYHYALEIGGRLMRNEAGRFRTFPEGPSSFLVTLACGDRWPISSGPAFDAMAKLKPLFFVHMGDFHYYDIRTNKRDLYRQAYEAIMGFPGHTEFYRRVPIAYMWDDHDYGPNNSDKSNPGREAARLTYQEYVPHYPLAAGKGDVPIYHAFSVGRVRFLMTDLRSERDGRRVRDDGAKSMLGVEQKAWFKKELLGARNKYPLIVWVSSVPWTDNSRKYDGWAGFKTERREIADFIKKNKISGVCVVAGDAHMIAIDDGANGDYAEGGGAPIPVFQAGGSLASPPSMKGGPYNRGSFVYAHQFGAMKVVDKGEDKITVTWQGFRCMKGSGGKEGVVKKIVSYTFSVPAKVQ